MTRELEPLDPLLDPLLAPLLARARDLPFARPSREQVEDMRTSVLAMMPVRRVAPRRTTAWLAIAGGALAAAGIALALLRGSPDVIGSRRHASVQTLGPAVFARSTNAPDEIIRLADGALHLEVSPLGHGERCRVIVGDAEVEVRGTAFEVTAQRGHLVKVVVEHGRVEVRASGVATFVGAGERWVPPPAEVVIAVVPPPPAPRPIPKQPHRVIAPVVPIAAQRPPAASGRDAELAFRSGWDALQAGDTATAATAFHRAVTLEPNGNIADDASYWRAIALVRAHRAESARNALELFLADFPTSMHAGDASVALGWLLIDTGELERAREQFRRARADPSARVRENAAAGLAALTK